MTTTEGVTVSHHWYTRKPKLILPVLAEPTPAPTATRAPPLVLPPTIRPAMFAGLETCPKCEIGWRHGAFERCWNCEPPDETPSVPA